MSDRPNSSQEVGVGDHRASEGGSIAMRRREMMALSAGALASVALYACGAGDGDATRPTAGSGATSAPDCVLTPEQEEGPFYIDLARVRQDIVEDRPGVPLALTVAVLDSNTCRPIDNAAVDIWHCDALGMYSGEPAEGSAGETYLRGIQLTDGDGQVEFATIYPGQYPGRTTHIHVKVHIDGKRGGGTYSGGHVSHTGQLFTSDRHDAEVFALAPYNRNTAAPTPRNEDAIFLNEGGSSSELTLAPAGSSVARDGFAAKVTLGVDPRARGAPA